MHEAQQHRHDRLLAAGDPPRIEALWQSIHDRVFMRAIPRVRWKDDEDVYRGPTLAWTAALVGTSGSLGIELDQGGLGGEWRLASEWRWLRAHWPCAYFWPWGEVTLAKAAPSHPHEARQLSVC